VYTVEDDVYVLVDGFTVLNTVLVTTGVEVDVTCAGVMVLV